MGQMTKDSAVIALLLCSLSCIHDVLLSTSAIAITLVIFHLSNSSCLFFCFFCYFSDRVR